MTSSEEIRERAATMISQMAALLDEGRMVREIDEPIDDAVKKLGSDGEASHSCEEFHKAVCAFTQRILETALSCPRRVSPSQAHDEAVAWLEEGYQGTYDNGFDGALVDATDPAQGGIPLVLVRMAEWIKRRQRRMYLRCVAARHIDPADWRTRCAMAEILLERCREWLPPWMQSYLPEQLADSHEPVRRTASVRWRILLPRLDRCVQVRPSWREGRGLGRFG